MLSAALAAQECEIIRQRFADGVRPRNTRSGLLIPHLAGSVLRLSEAEDIDSVRVRQVVSGSDAFDGVVLLALVKPHNPSTSPTSKSAVAKMQAGVDLPVIRLPSGFQPPPRPATLQ